MNQDVFIPQDVEDLYEKLKSENLQGELYKEGDWLIWKLPNDIILKITVNNIQWNGEPSIREGYIGAYYLKDGKERALTHWHPTEDEIYPDLMDIRNGQTIWVKRKSIWGEQIIIMDKKEYETLSDKKKQRVTIMV